MKLIAGTRGSVLALKQVDIVAKALKKIDPRIQVEPRVIKTHGDINLKPIPLDTIGKGWFTHELEEALRDKSIDFAVHSLKDLAENMAKDLALVAYIEREDARDALITKDGTSMEELRPGAIIGTDSTRRQKQMLAIRPNVVMKSIRGNVPSRIEKLYKEDYDAVILAAAGLKRLALDDKIVHYFSIDEMTPAPGQGILSVQILKSNAALKKLFAKANDAEVSHAALLERSFSTTSGGGCKSPSGAYAWKKGSEWHMTGMLADDSGKIYRESVKAKAAESKKMGERLARQLLKKIHG